MKASEKLKKYIDVNSLCINKIARRVGMFTTNFHAALSGSRPFPERTWLKIVEFTNGYVSLEDFAEEAFRRFPSLQVIKGRNQYECIISFKDLNVKKDSRKIIEKKLD